jgi:predicted GTPase
LAALEATINNSDADLIISATPVDLARLLHLNKMLIRARYEYAEVGEPTLSSIIDRFVARIAHARSVS